MANAWDGISTAFLVRRQVSRRCFDEYSADEMARRMTEASDTLVRYI